MFYPYRIVCIKPQAMLPYKNKFPIYSEFILSLDGVIWGQRSDCSNRFCARAWRVGEKESVRTYVQRSTTKLAYNDRRTNCKSVRAF